MKQKEEKEEGGEERRKKEKEKEGEGEEEGRGKSLDSQLVVQLGPQEPQALALRKMSSMNQLGLAPLSQEHGFTGPSLTLEAGKPIMSSRQWEEELLMRPFILCQVILCLKFTKLSKRRGWED